MHKHIQTDDVQNISSCFLWDSNKKYKLSYKSLVAALFTENLKVQLLVKCHHS